MRLTVWRAATRGGAPAAAVAVALTSHSVAADILLACGTAVTAARALDATCAAAFRAVARYSGARRERALHVAAARRIEQDTRLRAAAADEIGARLATLSDDDLLALLARPLTVDPTASG